MRDHLTRGLTLALDTALSACSAAIVEQGRVICEQYAEPGKGHAELLMGQINAVLADANAGIADITRLAVTTGPGSFAGVRIALSVARGMALVTDAPTIGVTTLEALAEAAPADTATNITAVIDARRGELYVQSFTADKDPLGPAVMISPDEAAQNLPDGPLVLVGSGAAILLAASVRADITVLDSIVWPRAAHVGRLATERPEPARPPDPFYLRAPDAKLPGTPGTS